MEDTTLKEQPVEEASSTPEVAQTSQQAPQVRKPSGLKGACAILSILLAIVAWGVFFFSPVPTAVIASISAITAIIGITVGKGCLRDIAITALIAAAILLIVLAIFYWGVPAAIESI